jgi:hypothetical protein
MWCRITGEWRCIEGGCNGFGACVIKRRTHDTQMVKDEGSSTLNRVRFSVVGVMRGSAQIIRYSGGKHDECRKRDGMDGWPNMSERDACGSCGCGYFITGMSLASFRPTVHASLNTCFLSPSRLTSVPAKAFRDGSSNE